MIKYMCDNCGCETDEYIEVVSRLELQREVAYSAEYLSAFYKTKHYCSNYCLVIGQDNLSAKFGGKNWKERHEKRILND